MIDSTVISRTASELRRINWDEPYRWLASLVAVATVVGGAENARALRVLARWADGLGASGVARGTQKVDSWLAARLDNQVAAVALVVVAVVAVATITGRGMAVAENRSAATLWLAWVLSSYTAGGASVVATTAGVAAITVVLLRGFDADHRSTGPLEWLVLALGSVAIAALYVPLAALAWLVGSDRTPAPVPEAPLPTGAVR